MFVVAMETHPEEYEMVGVCSLVFTVSLLDVCCSHVDWSRGVRDGKYVYIGIQFDFV